MTVPASSVSHDLDQRGRWRWRRPATPHRLQGSSGSVGNRGKRSTIRGGTVLLKPVARKCLSKHTLAHGEATSLPFADRSFIRAKWRRSPDRMSGSGPDSDFGPRLSEVRSSPNNGHVTTVLACPKSAKKRHPVVSRSVECESAWGPIADRPHKRSIDFVSVGSMFGAVSQHCKRNHFPAI
jgi:hypothetical protein